jgi:hypothetical protein
MVDQTWHQLSLTPFVNHFGCTTLFGAGDGVSPITRHYRIFEFDLT